MSNIFKYTASLDMMYSAANSASVADVITCLMMCAMLSTVPLFCGIVALFDKKNILRLCCEPLVR